MKDGRTPLAYKAEHVIDPRQRADTESITPSGQTITRWPIASEAQRHVHEATDERPIDEVAADKGYDAAEQLELVESLALRTHIPEPQRNHKSRCTDKSPELKAAAHANRRRTKRAKSQRLQRLRSKRVERSFAHICESGGARRTRLRGIDKVSKRDVIAALARNLKVRMRALFGMGTPRGLQPEDGHDHGLAGPWQRAWLAARSLKPALAPFLDDFELRLPHVAANELDLRADLGPPARALLAAA